MVNNHSSIIVISVLEDEHIPYVQKHLSEQMIIVDASLHAKSSLRIIQNSQSGVVVYNDLEIVDPKSIWHRKPAQVINEDLPVAAKDFDYCKSSLENLRASLYTLFPNALRVSDYYAMVRAMNKPAQLEVARKLGFSVPDTLFTNDSSAAKAFIKSHTSTVVKSLSYINPISKKGTPLIFYTYHIEKHEKTDFSGLIYSPVIFQQEIDAIREIRVTIVDTKVFVASIATKGVKKSHVRDYREVYLHPQADLIIEPFALPNDIRDKCIAHAKAFNLKFSAIDLLEDKNGKYWFLENNPNGQWAFIEDATGQQIGNAIAELLMSDN